MVQSLEAVSADLLLGLDIISATGGVRLTYGEEPGVLMHVTFGARPVVAAAREMKTGPRSMPRHVTVVEDSQRVTLKTDDGDATFLKELGRAGKIRSPGRHLRPKNIFGDQIIGCGGQFGD